jgi:outer membrane murein-binding lipoprotein Lpp
MKSVLIASGLISLTILLSGCASTRSVKKIVAANNATYDQAIAQVDERVDQLTEDQYLQKENLLNYLKQQNQLLTEFILQLEEKESVEAEQPQTQP